MTGTQAQICRETRAKNSCERSGANRRLIVCDLDAARALFEDSSLVALAWSYCNSVDQLEDFVHELRYWRYVRFRLGEGRSSTDLGNTTTRWRSDQLALTRNWTQGVTYWYLDLGRGARASLFSSRLKYHESCETQDEE
jgi:hypothetical protein